MEEHIVGLFYNQGGNSDPGIKQSAVVPPNALYWLARFNASISCPKRGANWVPWAHNGLSLHFRAFGPGPARKDFDPDSQLIYSSELCAFNTIQLRCGSQFFRQDLVLNAVRESILAEEAITSQR